MSTGRIDAAMRILNKSKHVWSRREWSDNRGCMIYVISHGQSACSYVSEHWSRCYNRYLDRESMPRIRTTQDMRWS